MEEKEYLLCETVFHPKRREELCVDGVKCDAICDAKCDADVDDDADGESGIFCTSSDCLKSDPTVSLSYWMGQLLTEKLVSGKAQKTFVRGLVWLTSRLLLNPLLSILIGHLVSQIEAI